MSFEPVSLRLIIDAQIVTFYPDSTKEDLNRLRVAFDSFLKEHGAKHEFLIGSIRYTLESKP